MEPLVAIVGRPNVGKSSLFNRIIGRREALEYDQPGVTRDRHYGRAEWNGASFTCIDTGGFAEDGDVLSTKVDEQIEQAIEQADVIVCVFDGRQGVTIADTALSQKFRSATKPVLYLINKIDTQAQESLLNDFYSLGLETVWPVSASHGYRFGDFLDALVEALPERALIEDEMSSLKLALVGRPNVGKSSLTNAILGEERVVVDATPGTTRDTIDSYFTYEGQDFCLLDTAGVRRHARRGTQVEQLSVLKSMRAIEQAHLCALVMDASESLGKQEAALAGEIEQKRKGFIVVANKQDLISRSEQAEWEQQLRDKLPFLYEVPIVWTAAKFERGVDGLLRRLLWLWENMSRKIPTSQINKLLEDLFESHPPPHFRGKEVKLYYMTQVGTQPQRFVLFCNEPKGVPDSYRRYLVKRMRQAFGLEDCPLYLTIKRRKRR